MSRTELLFDEDPITGTRTIFVPEGDDGDFTLVYQQEIDDILDDNQEQRKERDRRSRWKDVNHVARIPNIVLWELRKKGILDDETEMKKWLNDPENKVFRTREGRV